MEIEKAFKNITDEKHLAYAGECIQEEGPPGCGCSVAYGLTIATAVAIGICKIVYMVIYLMRSWTNFKN